MSRGEVLARAEFDSKLRLYLVLQGIAVLVATVAGIALVPVWAVAGPLWARRYYDRLECVLTARALVYKKGIVFRSEVTVPLDKIQDLSVKYGPILNWLGLAKLSVVTAGQHANQSADVGLVGVVDAPAFRDRVLDRRDEIAGLSGGSATRRARDDGPASRATPDRMSGPAAASLERIETLLREIRDLLERERQAP